MSEANPVLSYQQALRRRAAAQAKCHSVSEIIKYASSGLSTWPLATQVTGLVGVYPPVPKHYSHAKREIVAATWPSIQEIHEALLNLRVAEAECQTAFAAIPPEDRIGVAPPT